MPSGPKKRKASKRKMGALQAKNADRIGNGEKEQRGTAHEVSTLIQKEDMRKISESNGISASRSGEEPVKAEVAETAENKSASMEHEKLSRSPSASSSSSTSTDVVAPKTELQICNEVNMVEKKNVLEEQSVFSSEEKKTESGKLPIEKVESIGSVAPSNYEKREKVEALVSGESLSSKKEEKLIEQPTTITHEQQLHSEKKTVNDVIPPQEVKLALWWNCCGLLDIFSPSNR